MNRKDPKFQAALAKIVEDGFVESSHHEAGHVVACFMVRGWSSKLERVCCEYDPESLTKAYVEWEGDYYDPALGSVIRFRSGQMAHDLMGPAAGGRVKGYSTCKEWLDEIVNEGHNMDALDAEGLDITKAIIRGAVFYKSDKDRMKWIEHIALFSHELVNVPRVWKTIEALAAAMTFGKTLSGAKAMAIVDKAYGDYAAKTPIDGMGGDWVKRLETLPLPRTTSR